MSASGHVARDFARKARQDRCRSASAAVFGTAAMAGHATAHASTAVVSIAGGLFVAAGGLTMLADQTGAPEQVVWMWAALAGTMAGAFAGVMVAMIQQPRATAKRHLAYLLLAFVFGMIGAPLVGAAWTPEPPKHIPMAFIWFSMSGLGGFLAPALAIALSKRSDDVANEVIDKFSTPKQARDARHRDNANEPPDEP